MSCASAPPVDLNAERSTIADLSIGRIFQRFRGRPHGDMETLAPAIVAVLQLAVHEGGDVVDAEINPLIVNQIGEGATAVDALVALARREDK